MKPCRDHLGNSHISMQYFCDVKALNMNYEKKSTFWEDESNDVSVGCMCLKSATCLGSCIWSLILLVMTLKELTGKVLRVEETVNYV